MSRPRRSKLTPVGREALTHVANEHLAGRWARSRRAGERASLASLYYNGWLVRRAWRGTEGKADAAYEYQLAPVVEQAVRAKVEAKS